MKIGILTYQRAENYGALLQAFASLTYLKRLGYDVELIDYWPEYHERNYKLFFTNYFRSLSFGRKMAYLIVTILSLPWILKRKKNFKKFMYERLNLPSRVTYRKNDCCDKYDIVLYGSDQIWRKQKVVSRTFYDEWYFGSNNIIAKKKIAMAASAGALNITGEDQLFFQNHMGNFSSVLVREKDLHEFLSSINITSQIVADPVFLINSKEWETLARKNTECKEQKYILFYNLLRNNESVEFVEKLQKHYGYKIKEINKGRGFRHQGNRYVKSASVEDFLSLIRDAELVVSNSFHGVAFSIIFEKQFYAIGMRNKSERVKTLLGALDIKDRYINENVNINLDSKIDFRFVNEKLTKLRNKFQELLNFSIEK